YNDSAENLNALSKFMAELGLKRIDLLPYHALGKQKYERLGVEYKLGDLKSYESEQVAAIKTVLESHGLEVGVG
ncbi:MAG: glycyl-radical enzyme activating protein, partial [Dehalococcoidia bacterium]